MYVKSTRKSGLVKVCNNSLHTISINGIILWYKIYPCSINIYRADSPQGGETHEKI